MRWQSWCCLGPLAQQAAPLSGPLAARRALSQPPAVRPRQLSLRRCPPQVAHPPTWMVTGQLMLGSMIVDHTLWRRDTRSIHVAAQCNFVSLRDAILHCFSMLRCQPEDSM